LACKPGAVSFGFAPKGLVIVDGGQTSEDRIMEMALEAGAEDVVDSDGTWEITCEPPDFIGLREALAAAGIEPLSAELTMNPGATVACDAAVARKVMRLVDALEEHDDVQKVYTNADITDDVMSQIE